MALQWEGVIATAAEYAGSGSNYITGRMYCNAATRTNLTIYVTGIYVGHMLNTGYDDYEWQADMWCNSSQRLSDTQTKGRTGLTWIDGNWYYSTTASHSWTAGTSSGTFSLQANWRADHYSQVSATRTCSGISYPAAGSPTLDSQSNSENTTNPLTSRDFTWTSSPGTNCTFSSLKIQYGLTTSYGSEKTGLSEDSSTTISSLSPGTTYHYRYVMTNGASLTTNSSDYSFTLNPVPTTSLPLLQVLGIA